MTLADRSVSDNLVQNENRDGHLMIENDEKISRRNL